MQFTQKSSSAGRIIWDKVNGGSDQSDCEIAWTNCIKCVRLYTYMWNGMHQGKSIKEPRTMQGNKTLNEKRIHPNQKPVILYKMLLKDYADPSMTILDTHGGSMSIAIACHDLDMNLVVCERDKDIFDTGMKRLAIHKLQSKLF